MARTFTRFLTLILFTGLTGLAGSIALNGPAAFAATDKDLPKKWESAHIISRVELTEAFQNAIKRADKFRKTAEAPGVTPLVRKKRLTRSIKDAKQGLSLARAFLAFQETSPTLDRHVDRLDALLDQAEPNVEAATPAKFLRVGKLAEQGKGVLRTIAGLLGLKI